MSIEVQKAPHITQIVLDNSNNDLTFSLGGGGVITNSSKNTASKHIKSKENISNSSSEAMASKYTDGYDSYEDDFDEESPARHGSRTRTKRQQPRKSSFLSETHSDSPYTPSPPTTRRPKKNPNSRRNSLVSYRSAYGASRASNKPSHKKTKKSQSANSHPVRTEDHSMMVQKILSANRNKITKLYNVVEELQQEVDHLRDENKTLKRIHVKQEKELKRVDRDTGSLPQLLQRHSAELRTYRERLKKNKVEITRKEKESHSNDVELTKLRDKVQHYKQLDNDKKLEERASLGKKLEKVEKVLGERDTKITDLQKTIKLSEKARQREIKEQQDRYKKTKDELINVQENVLSLREKLKGKEKQLDMTNIYHQNIQRKLKKANPLALPPPQEEDLHIKNEPTAVDSSHFEKKRTNIFLTHAPSDKSSSISTEVERSQPRSEPKKSTEAKEYRISDMDESLEFERAAARLKEELQREEEKARRWTEEAEVRLREEERKREEEQMREQIRRLEKEKARKEKEEKRKQEEEERIRIRKEEQERLKFKEDEETRRKKDLLLARMKAIDSQTDKPNGIITMDLNAKPQDEKPKKLPIFLQSSQKPKESTEEPSLSNDNEKHKTGSSTSVRSKHSQSSSYDFKETVKNLHHGLPAHPSDQHLRGRHNSLEDEPSFGAYKPTVGRRESANKKNESLGSYNPSFGETKKQDKTTTPDNTNDLVFGSYQPTLGGNSNPQHSEYGGLDFSSKKNEGRRGRQNQPNSIFGEEIFNKNEKPKRNSIFHDDPFSSSNTAKDKNYPWEKKVHVSVDHNDDSLLPKRSKLNQGHKQNVPAIGNILNGTLDDDIEEVTL